ncbi:MAG: glycosyltransferase, partial [Bacteroidales bacterium]|nr:glycosyltransferase [Bacteroidales bacterium]
KDNTMDIVKEYEPRFGGRMKWISEKDHGIYDAMNKGLALATGEVVGILNSDDFYTSHDVLSTVADAFAKDAALDAVYADIHYVHSDNLDKCIRYYSSKKFKPARVRMGYLPAHPSFYCRRECYEKFGNFDTGFVIGADFENIMRLIYLGRIKTQYIEKDFVTMRAGGISSNGLKSHRQIIKDHRRAFRKNKVPFNPFLYFSRYPLKLLEYIFK